MFEVSIEHSRNDSIRARNWNWHQAWCRCECQKYLV